MAIAVKAQSLDDFSVLYFKELKFVATEGVIGFQDMGSLLLFFKMNRFFAMLQMTDW